MLSHIDIDDFGSYKELDWKKSLRDPGNNVQHFKRLNIIYGRNYSGKTTLSRIFRALETGRIPSNYASPSFTAYGDNGTVTHNSIALHGYDIRVYNRDFVNDNLSFLVNQNSGEIKTFAIVGEKNKEIEVSITNIENMLGSAEGKTGLRYELETTRRKRDSAIHAYTNAQEALNKKLRAHANDHIKKNREYGLAVYNIDNLKKDIATVKTDDFTSLSLDDQRIKSALLKQEALPDINKLLNINLNISTLKENAKNLLGRNIAPTQPIQELLNDSVLQAWVKEGISHHRKKRDTCAFCGKNLLHNIWEVLDSHFSKESAELELAINACLLSIKNLSHLEESKQLLLRRRSVWDS